MVVAGTTALLVLVRVVLQIPVVAVTVVLLVALALLRWFQTRRSTGTAGGADTAARSATEREVLLRVVLPVPVAAIPVVLMDARGLRVVGTLRWCS